MVEKYFLVSLLAYLILIVQNADAQNSSASNQCLATIGDTCQAHLGYLIDFPLNYTLEAHGGVQWPSTAQEVSTFCTHIDDLQSCLRQAIGSGNNTGNGGGNSKFQICSKEELIQARKLSIMLSVYFKSVCITAKRREDALRRVECYRKPEVQKAVRPLTFRAYFMTQVGSSPPEAASVAHQCWCCAGLYFRDAVYQVNREHCSADTTEEIHHLVQDVIGPTYHESCGQATTYKACFAGLTPPMQEAFKKIEDFHYPA